MLFKKSKAIIAAALSAAVVSNVMVATVASAAGTRTKPEAFGEDTYAERFLSLYDDVVTNGVENGYLSKNGSSSSAFGIPFHAVEEVIIEAPDYGHETTSEAMSYLVWVAAMRDNIAKNMTDQVDEGDLQYTADLAKAWATMENMIPTVQDNFWGGQVSAQYCGEYDNPEDCPDLHAADSSKTASNPIHSYFTQAYSGQKGLYLMHWLADVENWYGFGSGTDFTFINTFQRGEQESCWETVPHPCIEERKYGNPQRGMKGIFNRDTEVAMQYAYTNAPDAEDRAIQAVYDANRWGVGDSNVSAKAAMMGDELRNNMFDKYYQTIGESSSWTNGNAGYDSAHYLMNWYTSWGGALASSGQNWVWQIGCSHAHEFYQNPLAAFALIQDADLKSGMKAQDAVKDYTTSLERQMEFYLWLQSNDGPIAGGATNSYKGRYEAYPSGVSTFYGMMYTEHPVYADPGSNHWIGNQVWAVQRLAELYYWVKTEGNTTGVKPGGMELDAALEQILDKWCAWFVNNSVLTDDGDFYIPSNLNWSGQPDKWGGSATDNTGLTCTITGYGNTDFGCVASLANTLIYYAKAKGVESSAIAGKTYDCIGSTAKAGIVDGVTGGSGGTAIKAGDAQLGEASLYLAQQLMDRVWAIGRDDIGLTRTDHNGSLARFFSQPVHVPSSYTGTMPNGDTIASGATFLSLRSMYESQSNCKGVQTTQEAIDLVAELKAAYEKDVAAGASWSGNNSASSDAGKAELADFTNVGAVELQYHRFWHAGDALMALGTFAELYPEMVPTTGSEVGPTDPTDDVDPNGLLGDVNVDGKVTISDVLLLNKNLMAGETLTAQGAFNADVDQDGTPTSADALNILKYTIMIITSFPV
ncbi:MAG: cellulose 1,4-beta-cellobiosidase [Oscillospiraceae bacterium]|nr:cellulose 1,4-beta-cellobiosidase [Oscillospiraceae bacterium]